MTTQTTTRPKPFCFVLMPFDASFNDIYEFGIKGACADTGIYCERVDEQVFLGSMLERIYSQISRADLLVADMTGKNPNVFYEVGVNGDLKLIQFFSEQRLKTDTPPIYFKLPPAMTVRQAAA